MKFVEDWKQAYKWLSVHVATIIVMFNTLQATIAQIQAFLSPQAVAVTNAVLAVALIWARLLRQGEQS